jgi:HAD superfamily hydrolase (TIGR01484 family)
MRKKTLLIMSDLDGTLIPAKLTEMQDFFKTLKKIEKDLDVQIKFSFITGRPAGYLLSTMDSFQNYFDEYEMNDPLGLGVAEQGGIIVYGKCKPYRRKYIGTKDYSKELANIKELVDNSKFKNSFEIEQDGKISISYVINGDYYEKKQKELEHEYSDKKVAKKELKKHVSAKYKELRDYLSNRIPKDIEIVNGGVLEIKPKEISKDKAVSYLFDRYKKKYDIKGIVYCGDSENDKKAIEYVSKLGLIPGIRANVYLPSNGKDEVRSENIEFWKNRLLKKGARKNVKISKYSTIAGISELLMTDLKSNQLIDKSSSSAKTKDDIGIRM